MADVKEEAMDIAATQPPLKKLKQARLPFKVISPKIGQQADPLIPTTPPSNKKRKLSDTAPGPNKASKTPRNDENLPKVKKTGPKAVSDAENEVSSSSEAEVTLKKCSVKIERCKKSVFMDQFIRKPQQLEVSTTNSIDSSAIIDLTDSNDAFDNKSNCVEVTSLGDKMYKDNLVDSPKVCDTSSVLSERIIDKEQVFCDSTENQDNNIESGADKLSSSECNDGSKPEKLDNTSVEEQIPAVNSQRGNLSEINEEKQEDDDNDNRNNSLNETGESEKDLSTLSETSEKSHDESMAEEENLKSPGLNKNDGKPQSEYGKKPKTPASAAKKAEKEADRLRKTQEKEKLKLEKQREKEEKERLKRDEKEKKEKEKEEARKKKEQEKKEKVEQKEREKHEKLKQKEEEKKKKEEERQKKQEEKQKELEEKQRQKEEREKEKEEAKSKISEKQVTFFSSFFTKKEKDTTVIKEEQTNGNFIQFEVKSDMRLAPRLRREPLQNEEKDTLDSLMTQQSPEELYLKQLKKTVYKPGKGTQTWPSNEDDVIIMEESDKPEKKSMKAKYLSFHENYRPPYRGTWTKRSSLITPRNPLTLDKESLDYEVDSDLEWEEEEPGESVSDSGGEEDGEPEDEEDEDGFFVPHGYLSEGEGCEDEDDDVNPERMKVKQLARAKAFEMDMKKKTELLKPVCIGCCWWEPDQTNNPALAMLQKFQVVGFNSMPIDLLCNKFEKSKKKTVKEDKKKIQSQSVPEEAIPDLIRLVHGNRWSVQKLIREFREFWRRKSNGLDPLSQSGSADKSLQAEGNEDEEADTSQNEDMNDGIKYSMSKRQVDKTIKEIAIYERRSTYSKSCWYVHDAFLEKADLMDLTVPTQWVWVTKDPNKTTTRTATPSNNISATVAMTAVNGSNAVERSPTPTQNIQKEGSIMKFTKPGISPKFPVIPPKPTACSTPAAQGKGSILSKFKQDTPKRDSLQQRMSPAALFQPIDKAEEVTSTDCTIIDVEIPISKPDKNQPTLLSLLKGNLGTANSAKSSSPKTVETARENSLNSLTSNKNCVISDDKVKTATEENSSSTIGSSQELVLGSAECPMEID